MAWLEAQLAFRSYMPLKLEVGQWFLVKRERGMFSYPEIVALKTVPQNEEEYIRDNGMPIHVCLVDPGDPNTDTEWTLAKEEQIGWLDEGSHVDTLCDLELKHINLILKDYDSLVYVEVEEVEDEGEDTFYPYTPILLDGKVIIRYIDDELYDDDDDEEEQEDEDIYS